MDLVTETAAMQARADAARADGRRLALVPTMGALHDGHLALVRRARELADHVTVSIFVNPTQFAPGEDYERYPRTLQADTEKLRALGGVDAVFAPTVPEMYPLGTPTDGTGTWVETSGLDRHLCGAQRPGHFRGVTTVVTKLFHACRPHVGVFGRKDAQQLVILQRMARDLLFGIEVVGIEIQREADGLAFSSRNQYLSEEERAQAVVLSRAVKAARERVEEGERASEALVAAMLSVLRQAPDARVDYAEVVDAETLQLLSAPAEPGQRLLCAVAAYFGQTRLIDNVFVPAPAR